MKNQVIFDNIFISGKLIKIAIEKFFKPLHFTIDVEASKTVPYDIGSNSKKFNYAYEIHHVWISSETNNLAGTLIQINNKIYPDEIYFVDPTNNFKVQSPNSIYGKNFFKPKTAFADIQKYKFFLDLPKDWILNFLPYNTHGSAQMLYITFIGYEKTTRIIDEEVQKNGKPS